MSGPQETIVFREDVDALSLFYSESPGPDPRLPTPERPRADSQVLEQWNEPVSVTSQDSKTPSRLPAPCDVDDRLVEARGKLEQLCTLAVRFDSEYEWLAKVIGEVDARSASALDTLRNIEEQVVSLAAEFNRFETQTRARFDEMHGSSRTARTVITETPRATPVSAANVTVTPELRRRRVTVIGDRGMRVMGLVTLTLVSLAIGPSFRRIDQIDVASLAAPPTITSVPIPSRSTNVTLPLDQASNIPEPLDAPKGPNRTVQPLSSRPSPVKQPRAAVFVGSLAVYSDPPGAIVLVNGRRSGVTPLYVTRLRAGSHVVWLERDGYERWTNGVLVPANKLTRVSAKLQSLRTARSAQNTGQSHPTGGDER